ncbi:hypothetical protein WA026_002241 [Henosepilachna vigintioctopunctata]|uniref:Uncharacterized protein n=1 Tax=Henosepilachna vigintioctopunctata TaxID=420089 RepID=A0AAW1TZN7_9CUCU
MCCGSILLKPLSESYLLNMINSMKSNSAMGYDDMSTSSVKLVLQDIVGSLEQLIKVGTIIWDLPENSRTCYDDTCFRDKNACSIENYSQISILVGISS